MDLTFSILIIMTTTFVGPSFPPSLTENNPELEAVLNWFSRQPVEANRLITPELVAEFDRAGCQERVSNPVIIAKFFTPWSDWTWYATEFHPEDLACFGLIDGHELELGYFNLAEMAELRGPTGLLVERDLFFGSKHHLREFIPLPD